MNTPLREVVADALLLRAYEVVHHDPECPAIGGRGDDDCRCDAVPFLRDLKQRLATPTPEASAGVERLRVDRDWSEYPIGTKAHAVMGGYWIRVQHGWKWFNGSTFPTPGGDACGACIELPATATAEALTNQPAPSSAGVEERARCPDYGDAVTPNPDENNETRCADCFDTRLRTPAKTEGDVGRHPEDFCQLCGGPNIKPWFAPNALWNLVMGRSDGIVCPQCFVKKAEEVGIEGPWRLDTPPAQQEARAVDDAMVERVSEAVWPVAKSSMESRWDRAGTQRQDFVRRFVRAAMTAALNARKGEAGSAWTNG